MAKRKFLAHVQYCTNAGNPGVWSGDVEAYNHDHAHELARAACMKARGRNIMKIVGGDLSEYDPRPIPSDPFVMVRKSHLSDLSAAAESYLQDLESGISEGLYENTPENAALVERIQAALEAPTPFPEAQPEA